MTKVYAHWDTQQQWPNHCTMGFNGGTWTPGPSPDCIPKSPIPTPGPSPDEVCTKSPEPGAQTPENGKAVYWDCPQLGALLAGGVCREDSCAESQRKMNVCDPLIEHARKENLPVFDVIKTPCTAGWPV